jgi:hypothetical protein
VAGPQSIQRVPTGLLNLLSMASSGENPRDLAATVSGVLDLLQFYGLQQRQIIFATNAATAEGTAVPIPALTTWGVLFAANFTVAKTATMTALRAGIFVLRGSSPPTPMLMMAEELGPFGATETGSASFAFVPPYPLLLPPGSLIQGIPQIIGTDATANCTVVAEIGILG